MAIGYASEPRRVGGKVYVEPWTTERSIAYPEDMFATDALAGDREWTKAVRPSKAPIVVLDTLYGHEVVVDASQDAETALVSVSGYAVRHMALWVVLLSFGMLWSLMTGIAIAYRGYWLNPANGLFGCLAIICTALALAAAGRSRRA